MGKIIQILVVLVSLKILTTMLDEKEVGNYYLLLTLLTLFNFIFFNPLGQYYERHLIKWENNKNLSNATNIILLLRFCATLVCVFLAFIIYQFLEYDKYYSLINFLFFIFISLISGIHGVFLSAINILGFRIKFTFYMCFTLFLGLILSYLIVNYYNKTAIGWLYGIAVAQFIFSFFLYKYVVRNHSFSIEKIKMILKKEYIKEIVIFIIPVTITLFLQWGQNTSYRFIIENKYSLEILAFIAIGLTVSSSIFGAIESLATQYYNPIYLRKITNASKEIRTQSWNELASYMMPIYFLLTVYTIILSPYLTNLLVAEKFSNAYIYVMFGAIIEFFRVITNLIYTISQSEVKTNTTIIPYGIGFIFTITSISIFDVTDNFWLIPFLLCISNGMIFLLLLNRMKKLLNIKIDIINILKSFFYILPISSIFFINNDKTIFQSILVIGLSGIYLLFITYKILKRKGSIE